MQSRIILFPFPEGQIKQTGTTNHVSGLYITEVFHVFRTMHHVSCIGAGLLSLSFFFLNTSRVAS